MTKFSNEKKKGRQALGKKKKEDGILLPKLVPKMSETVPSDNIAFPRSNKVKKDTREEPNQISFEKTRVVSFITPNDLVTGSLVVGVINQVLDDEMEIDLPFHLTGFVSRDQACEPGIKMGRSDQFLQLKRRFRRGQLVTAAVVKNEGLRICLTLRPSIINSGLKLHNLSEHMWLPCTVKCFEDFGCSVDLGIENVNAYVTRPNLNQTHLTRQWLRLKQGSIFEVAVTAINIASRTVACSMNPDDAVIPISTPVDQSLIRAGFLVECKINNIVSTTKSAKPSFPIPPRALTATFCRVLTTTITGLHSTRLIDNGESSAEKGNITQVSIGEKLFTRIILQIPSRGLIFSSCLSHLIGWSGPFSSSQGYAVARCEPGTHLHSCRVVAVDPQFAARLGSTFNGVPIMADVARSRCLDDVPEKIPLQIGETVKEVRVLSLNLFELAVSVTTAPKLLKEPLLVVGDLKPGQVVYGEILFITDATIFVKLSEHVTGRLHKDQATDVPVAELPPKFQIGKKLKCRVLYIDVRSNAPYLTAKKTLVDDQNPVVDFATDCTVGKIAYGVVQKVLGGNLLTLVRFYGGITGSLPTNEFEKFNKQNKLKKGAVIQCQIVEADHLSRTMKLSLDLSSKVKTNQSPLAVCSEIMQSLEVLRRKKCCAVSPIEVADWFQEKADESLVKRLAPIRSWITEEAYIFSPRELRTFTTAGAIVKHFQILDLSDEFVSVLFIVKNIKCEIVDDDNDAEDDKESTTATPKGFALTVGIVPIGHLADDIKDVELIRKKLAEALLSEGSIQLEKIVSVPRRAVLLSSFCPLDFVHSTSRCWLPVLSFKSSIIESAKKGEFIKSLGDLTGLEMATRSGYVVRNLPSGLFVCMGSAHVRGYVPAKFASNQVIDDLSRTFPIGTSVRCKIVSVRLTVDPTSSLAPCIIDLRDDSNTIGAETTLRTSDPQIVSALSLLELKGHQLPLTASDIDIGQEYPAVVRKSGKTGVFVMLSHTVQARISLSQLTGEFIQPEQVAVKFPVGRVFSAVKVLSVGSKTLSGGIAAINVSLCQAGQFKVSLDDINVGAILGCVVKSKTSVGLILAIEDSDFEAMCHHTQVSDDHKSKQEAMEKFAIGDRVAAKVLEISRTGGYRIQATLKESMFKDEGEDFVTLQDELTMLKKKNNAQHNVSTSTRNGDADDKANKRNMSDVEDEAEKMKEKRNEDKALDMDGGSDDDTHTGSTISNAEIEEDDAKEFKHATKKKRLSNDGSNIEDGSNNTISGKKRKTDDPAETKKRSVVQVFHEANDSDSMNASKKIKLEDQSAEVKTKASSKKAKKSKSLNLDTDSSDNDDSNSETDVSRKKRLKRQSTAAKRREEVALREKEIETAKAEQEGLVAETPENFERLILTNGDSSAVWIRYMAFYLKVKDVERARGVAERGIRRISTKEDEERFNLWVAYLNLEAEFGTEQTLETTIRKALQYNDPKKILMQLTYLHQRRKEPKKCLEACKICINKYPESKKMWIRYLTCLFEQQSDSRDHDTSPSCSIDFVTTIRNVITQSMKKLPQRKHIPVMLSVGRLEFKLGSSERGRTYFEKLIAEHPKRVDIWGQYIDALLGGYRQHQISETQIRHLFEKATNSKLFKPRRMKYFFTRWLTFERFIECPEGEKNVQQKAREYVEGL